MKIPYWMLIAACWGCVAGCAYHGAVYSEYSQLGLDVRASQDSSAPIKLGFGYDRASCAYIPKHNGLTGEACSVITWDYIGSTVVPPQVAGRESNSVLQVDAGFISGTAANVASAPSNATVVIAPSPAGATPKLAKAAELSGFEVKTVGSPGDRVSAAAQLMKFQSYVDQAKLQRDAFNRIKDAYLHASAPQKERIRCLAKGLGLVPANLADNIGDNEFTASLSDAVNGNNPAVTEKLQTLEKNLNANP